MGVNPPVYDFAWFDLWAKPLGLLNLLGFLREQGNRVQLVDCLNAGRQRPLSHGRWKVERREVDKPAPYRHIPRRYYRFGLNAEDFRTKLESRPEPDLILVTSIMTYWYPGVFEAIALLKQVFPRTPIALGGIYALLCPGHAAKSGADVILGPAPPARPKTLPIDLYEEPGHAILATSYGCPLACQYCASSLISPHFSRRPLAEITGDLDRQLEAGSINDLAFYDDALLWDRPNLFYPLCGHIARKHPGLRLHSPNGLSVAMLDEECCRVLFQTGFKTLRLSLEGVDDYTGGLSSGKADGQKYLRAVDNLLKAGYDSENIETYILAGLPGQKLEDIESSLNFVKAAGASPKLCEFSPIPGTPLYQKDLREHPQLADDPLWHNNSVYISHLAERLRPEELQYLKGITKKEARTRALPPGPRH